MSATLQDLRNWYDRDLGRLSNFKTYANLLEDLGTTDSSGFEHRFCFIVYTDTNSYNIRAVERNAPAKSYLGCTSKSRKPRAGEDWYRGNDLADGDLSEETWRRILADIVAYELVHTRRWTSGRPDVVKADPDLAAPA